MTNDVYIAYTELANYIGNRDNIKLDKIRDKKSHAGVLVRNRKARLERAGGGISETSLKVDGNEKRGGSGRT